MLFAFWIGCSKGAFAASFIELRNLPAPSILIAGGEPLILGYEFTVGNADIRITRLGLFDFGDDGLLESHPIGLWDSAGVLQAFTTVEAGASAPWLSGYRYADLPGGLLLVSGGTYILAAAFSLASGDTQITGSPFTFDAASAITLGQGRALVSASLDYPTEIATYSGSTSFVGVNAEFVVVPEPASLLLTALSLHLMWPRRRSSSSTLRS